MGSPPKALARLPINGVLVVGLTVTVAFLDDVPWWALGVGVALFAAHRYENACWSACRRILWPFDTYYARRFAAIATDARRRREALTESTQRWRDATAALRAGAPAELTYLDATLSVDSTSDGVVVTFHPGAITFTDVFDDERTRLRFEERDGWDDPLQVNLTEVDAQTALLLDDWSAGPVSVSVRVSADATPAFEVRGPDDDPRILRIPATAPRPPA